MRHGTAWARVMRQGTAWARVVQQGGTGPGLCSGDVQVTSGGVQVTVVQGGQGGVPGGGTGQGAVPGLYYPALCTPLSPAAAGVTAVYAAGVLAE